MSKIIAFTNFTDESFTCKWDGKPYTFAPGDTEYFSEGKAEHFAKHLANKILVEEGNHSACSPKNKESVASFYDLYSQALSDEEEVETKTDEDLEEQAAVKQKTTKKKAAKKTTKKTTKKDDSEEEFAGLKED